MDEILQKTIKSIKGTYLKVGRRTLWVKENFDEEYLNEIKRGVIKYEKILIILKLRGIEIPQSTLDQVAHLKRIVF